MTVRTGWSAMDAVALLARFALAAVWIASGVLKMQNPGATLLSVRAYELFPDAAERFIALALPALEVALGVLLVLGIFLRATSLLSALIFLAFIAGIASAWARGLTIDCGCFGGGGYNSSVNPWAYVKEILRDTAFIALAAIVAWKPLNKLAVWP